MDCKESDTTEQLSLSLHFSSVARRVRLFVTPWPIQSMESSRPDYQSGQPIPSPADLPDPGIEPGSPALQVDSLPTELSGKPINTKKHYENKHCSIVSDSWPPHGLYSPWNSPGKNTGVGCHFLLQGIFPTQGSNLVSCIIGEFFTI